MNKMIALIVALTHLTATVPALASEANPGVSEVDFATGETLGTGGTSTAASISDPRPNVGQPIANPILTNPSVNPTQTIDNAIRANYTNLKCDQKCSVLTGNYNLELLDPTCGANAQCKSCLQTTIAGTQSGQYCTAHDKYENAKKKQKGQSAIFVVGAAVCLMGCVPSPVKPTFAKICPFVGLGIKASEMLMSKKMATDADTQTSGWLKIVGTGASLATTVGAAGKLAEMLKINAKTGVGVIDKIGGKVFGAMKSPCVVAGILTVQAAAKKKQASGYTKPQEKLCGQLDQLADPWGPAVKSCRDKSGMGTAAITAMDLAVVRPKPFTFDPKVEAQAAVNDGGWIEEISKGDGSALADLYNKLDPAFREKLESAEDPFAVMKSEGLMSGEMLDEADRLAALALKEGKSEILALGNADAIPGAIAGKQSEGDSASPYSFGSQETEVATGGDGVGVDEQGFGVDSANGANGLGCGNGFFHEGCEKSIFGIVSDQLRTKSKTKAVAELEPASKLNRMLAGVKAEESETKSSKKTSRAPAAQTK